MGKELSRRPAPARKRWSGSLNTMTFPRQLRDAIPDLPAYVGRVLEIESMDGDLAHTPLQGRHVRLRFTVKETGKLAGTFPVLMELQADAARALAETLVRLADQAAS